MPIPGFPQPPLNYAMLHDDALSAEFDTILGLSDTFGDLVSDGPLLHDTFTEGSDTVITSHVVSPITPTPAMQWTRDAGLGGTLAGTVNTAADALMFTSLGNTFNAWYVDATQANRTIHMKLKPESIALSLWMTALIRLVPATSGCYVGLKDGKLVIWDYGTASEKAASGNITLDTTAQEVTLVIEDDSVHITAYLAEETGTIVSTDPLGPTPPAPAYTPPNAASTLYGIYIETPNLAAIDALEIGDYKVFF